MSRFTRVWLVTAMLATPLTVCTAQNTAGADQRPAKSFGSSQERVRAISQTLSDQIPLIIAHRGASGYLPAHTTEAAAFAHALGTDSIHQDVMLSKDGIAVVVHEGSFQDSTNVATVFPDRHMDGTYSALDFTLQELQTLQVSQPETNADSSRFPARKGVFRIATLEEHLQLLTGLNKSRKRDVGCTVEIQQPAIHRSRGLDPAGEVLRLLQKFGYTDADDPVFVQCRDVAEIRRIRVELKCRLPLIQLLDEPVTASALSAHSQVADGICVPLHAVLTSEPGQPPHVTDLVHMAHQHALLVYVRTFQTDRLPEYAESPASLLDLLVRKSGVDGIFTDQPDVVLAWRQAATKSGPLRGPFHLLNNTSR